MAIYIDKRDLVNAIQWTGENINEIKLLTSAINCIIEDDDSVVLDLGDYSIKLLWNDFLCQKEKLDFYRVSLSDFTKYKVLLNEPNRRKSDSETSD